MSRPLLLDLFCGAGGAAVGYHRAGFQILGIDHKPQPHYPYPIIIADIFKVWHLLNHERIDAYHASPPCQAYSKLYRLRGKTYPALIPKVRNLLKRTGKPYVIENVMGAPLRDPLMLCGSMFPDLRVYRHRLFECSPPIYFPPAGCNHWGKPVPSQLGAPHQNLDDLDFITVAGARFKAEDGRKAMGIDWMNRDELAQSIPPHYTTFIGKQLMEAIQ